MPKHPDTGKYISNAAYERLMRSRRKHAEPESDIEPSDRPEMDLDPRQPGDDYRYPAHSSPTPSGCLIFLMGLCLIGLTSFVVWDRLSRDKSPAPAPPVAPVVTPAGPVLDGLVAPIRQKLAYEPEKARKVFAAYSGLRDAIQGPSGQRVTDTRIFAAVTSALLTDIDAGGGTPIGRDIDQAVASHLGISWGRDSASTAEGWEFKQFADADRVKLVEVLGAIAKAAEDTL
jgi:hypothetical protein